MTQRMLIVEPDHTASTLFDQWLQDLGCKATSVRNGGEAMHTLRTQSIDGLILELQVPVMDGLTMLTQLRQRYADIPVIVLASVDMTDLLLEALESGASDYLTKPVCNTCLNKNVAGCFFTGAGHRSGLIHKHTGMKDSHPS